MAKEIRRDGPIHTAVMAWMRENNIELNMVRSYKIERENSGEMWIDVSMWVNDVKPKPAKPAFVADNSGNVWMYDAPRDGYQRASVGGTWPVSSLDFIRKHYRIAEVQPPHATCQNVTSPADSGLTWVCTAACSTPAKPICLCGSRSPDPEMHDVIACPIGSAEYERTHASDS